MEDKKTDIDKIGMAIIKQLRDGRKSFKKIADELSVTENTIRSRVKRLESNEVLEIQGTVDPETLPGHKIVIIGMNIDHMNLVKKGGEISRLKGVVSVSVVTGRFDLLVTVLLKEGYGLLEFYTDELAKVKAIKSVETFVVYKGFNIKVPYVL